MPIRPIACATSSAGAAAFRDGDDLELAGRGVELQEMDPKGDTPATVKAFLAAHER